MILWEQTRTVGLERTNATPIAELSPETMEWVEEAMRHQLRFSEQITWL